MAVKIYICSFQGYLWQKVKAFIQILFIYVKIFSGTVLQRYLKSFITKKLKICKYWKRIKKDGQEIK